MKVTNHEEQAYVSKNLETYQAGISMNAEMFKILFSGIYKNKQLAPQRELICNARDSHIEAGVNRPISVHYPTMIEPWFSVTDYGLGMSKEMVTKTFMNLGTSTKRESNDLIGAKGIGSKSPLALVDGFQVSSIWNGTKTAYNIYKNKGIPDIAVVASNPTTEHNGTEVKFFVEEQYIQSFCREAENFLPYFDYPLDIVQESITSKLHRPIPLETFIDDETGYVINIYCISSDNVPNNSYVVMGGVPYLSSTLHWIQRNNGYSAEVYVPIGECDVDPARENTVEGVDDGGFANKLRVATHRAIAHYEDRIKREISDFTTFPECFNLNKNCSRTMRRKLHDYVQTQYVKVLASQVYAYTRHNSKRGATTYIHRLGVLDWRMMFIVRDDDKKIAAKCRQVLASQGVDTVCVVDEKHVVVDDPRFKNMIILASDITLEEQPKQPRKAVVREAGHKVVKIISSGKERSFIGEEELRLTKKEISEIKWYIGRHDFTSIADLRKSMEVFGVDELYRLTERQQAWVKNGQRYKPKLTSEHKQLAAAYYRRQECIPTDVAKINSLHKFLGLPFEKEMPLFPEKYGSISWMSNCEGKESLSAIEKETEKLADELRNKLTNARRVAARKYPLIARLTGNIENRLDEEDVLEYIGLINNKGKNNV